MPKGQKLSLLGRYEEAIPELRKAAHRYRRQDDFLAGPEQVGIACMLAGNFRAAEVEFRHVIDDGPYTMSPPLIYMGLMDWHRGDHHAAVEWWLRATKAQYCHDSGHDSGLALYYAAVRDPTSAPMQTALDRITKVLPRLDPDYKPYFITRYIFGELTELEFRPLMLNCEGKFAKPLSLKYGANAEFYIGLKALLAGDEERFEQCIRTAAAPGLYFQLTNEMIFARMECQYVLDRKRKRAPAKRKVAKKSTSSPAKRGTSKTTPMACGQINRTTV